MTFFAMGQEADTSAREIGMSQIYTSQVECETMMDITIQPQDGWSIIKRYSLLVILNFVV